MQFTNATIQARLAENKQGKLHDERVKGFYIIFNGYGQADFAMRYRSPQTRKDALYIIGRYGKALGQMNIIVALSHAQSIRRDLDEGLDPQKECTERRAQTAAYRAAVKSSPGTVAAHIDSYLLIERQQCRLSTYKMKVRDLGRFKKAFGRKRLSAVSRQEILALLDELAAGSNGAAMSFIRSGSAFWNWALEEGFLYVINPFEKMRGRKKRYKAKAKDRVLDASELTALAETHLPATNPATRRALLVMLYTNCRPGMASRAGNSIAPGMDWAEISWERREWVIEAGRMKAKNRHVVPLPTQLYDLLREWWTADGSPSTGPVVPTRRNTYALVTTISAAVKTFDMGFTPHDIRRTVSSQIMGMGCPFDVRRALRAHIDAGDVAAIYDRDDLYAPKKEWLQKWADRLDELGYAGLANKDKADRLQIGLVEERA